VDEASERKEEAASEAGDINNEDDGAPDREVGRDLAEEESSVLM
jgi:hypothetical protein